jgi:hypothetical protein
MSQIVPDQLVDIALNALDDEVKRWRRVPWAPGYIRLMRYPDIMDAAPGLGTLPTEDDVITCHDVPVHMADDMIVRFAMEKALEAAISAISVAPPAPAPRRKRGKKAAKS